MAVQLPQQPRDARVVLPAAPGNPPVLADVYRAVKFKRNVLDSAASGHVSASTPDDLSRAVVYEHAVTRDVAAGGVAPPPWFGPIQQQLNRIETKVNRIEASVATAKNAINGDGSTHGFEIVPFNDGTDPIAAPHMLPPLTSVAIINALPAISCNRYLDGYGVPRPNGVANVRNRRRLLKVAIGCRTL